MSALFINFLSIENEINSVCTLKLLVLLMVLSPLSCTTSLSNAQNLFYYSESELENTTD